MNHIIAHSVYPLLKNLKYSIHSPTCRLYTIDEVNSTYSENDQSTHKSQLPGKKIVFTPNHLLGKPIFEI